MVPVQESMVSIPWLAIPSDYANHSVLFSDKFNNGFGEENNFNCLIILLTDHVVLWITWDSPSLLGQYNRFYYSWSHSFDGSFSLNRLLTPLLKPFYWGISTSFQTIWSSFDLWFQGFKWRLSADLFSLSKSLIVTLLSHVLWFYFYCCSFYRWACLRL